MHLIGSGGICKVAFNPLTAAGGGVGGAMIDENGNNRLNASTYNTGHVSVPVEAGAGALLGLGGAYALNRGIRSAAARYRKSTMGKAVENVSKRGKGVANFAHKLMRKGKLPMLGAGLALGGILGARSGMKQNEEREAARAQMEQ